MKRRDFISTIAGSALGAACLAPKSLFAAQKANWQIGIYTRPWDKQDYRQALDAMAKAGYKYAGMMTHKKGLVISVKTSERAARKIGEEAKQRGLQIISVYGGGFYADKSLKAGLKGLKKLVDNVAACDGKNLLLGGVGKRKNFNTYYKAVRETCDYAAQQGVILTLKPHGGLNATGPQCRKIIEMVGHPNFHLWYDPGNIFYYSDGALNPLDDVESVKELVSGLCIKDFKMPKDVLVTPGTGMVEFSGLFATLKEAGLRGGPLVIECLKPGGLDEIHNEAKKARIWLQELVG